MRVLVLALTGLALAGCQTPTDWRAVDDAAAALRAECRHEREVGLLATRAAEARCGNDMVRALYRDHGAPYPDLYELNFATRVALAEKLDRGQISEAEAAAEMAALRVRIVSEYQRRRSAEAQARAAAVAAFTAAQPVVCTHGALTTVCN